MGHLLLSSIFPSRRVSNSTGIGVCDTTIRGPRWQSAVFKPCKVLDLWPITILQREAGRDAAEIYLQKVTPLSFGSELGR